MADKEDAVAMKVINMIGNINEEISQSLNLAMPINSNLSLILESSKAQVYEMSKCINNAVNLYCAVTEGYLVHIYKFRRSPLSSSIYRFHHVVEDILSESIPVILGMVHKIVDQLKSRQEESLSDSLLRCDIKTLDNYLRLFFKRVEAYMVNDA